MLVTLTQAKNFLGITSAVSDAALALLIDAASVAVEVLLGRELTLATVAEKRAGNGSSVLWLRNFPVASVASVKINGTSIALVSDGDFNSRGIKLVDRGVFYQGGFFQKGFANVEIIYSAGYIEIPMDIQKAVAEIAGLGLKQRDHLDVSSKSLAGETISYVISSMPASAKEVLNGYKQVLPI